MPERLRITFVAMAYAPSVGGSQRHVQRLAEGLVARGHDVEVLTTDVVTSVGAREPGRVEALDEVIGGVRVRRHRTPEPLRRVQRATRGLWARRPGASERGRSTVGPWLAGPLSPSLLASVRIALADRDVVVACSAPFTTFVGPPRLPGRRHAAVVGMPLLHLARTELAAGVRRALRRCDVLVASTEPERAAQRAVVGADVAIHVVPPGADLEATVEATPAEARASLGLPEHPTVGFIGRLAEYKGIDTLLEATSRLSASHPEVVVLVAGRPAGFDVARAAAAAGVAGERLVLRESFTEEEKGLLLAACDVVAIPSRDESFGLVLAEGWAARRAVVAADIAAVRSIVRPGLDAELVPTGDAEALAAVVGELLDAPERRERLAAAGRRRVEEELSWPVVVGRWDELLQAAAAPDRAVA